LCRASRRPQNLYYARRQLDSALALLEAATSEDVLPTAATRSHYRARPQVYRRHCATANAALATALVEALGVSQRERGRAHVIEQARPLFSRLQQLQSQVEAALDLAPGEADDTGRVPSQVASVRAAMSRLQLLTAAASGASAERASERREQDDLVRARAREVNEHAAAAQKAARLEFAARAEAATPASPSAARASRREGAVPLDDGSEVEGFSVPACLAQAEAAFRQDDFARARSLFARAVRAAPDTCPAGARVGLGLCLYRLGHIAPALNAMRRALQLDSALPSALAGFAVLKRVAAARYTPQAGDVDAQSKEQVEEEARAQAHVLLTRAHGIAPRDPTVLLPLAQLTFDAWEPVASRAPGAAEDAAVTVLVRRRSSHVWCSAPVAHLLRPGEAIRLGDRAVILAQRHDVAPDKSGTHAAGSVLRLSAAYAGDTTEGLPLLRRAVDKAGALARTAAEASSDTRLRAEAHFLSAKAHHVDGSMLDAYVEYKRCHDADPAHLPAVFGRAQFMLSQRRPKDARKLAEQVLEKQADNADALRMLARLDKDEGRASSAARHAARATDVAPGDYDAWLLRAEIAQVHRSPEALREAVKAYRHAGKLLQEHLSATPFELWANLGALSHSLGADNARDFYMHALHAASAEAIPDRADDDAAVEAQALRTVLSPKCATLAFNLALLHESRGEAVDAADLYQKLVRLYPGYSDAAMRLGILEQRRGDLVATRRWLTRAVEAARGGPQGENALAALGRLMDEQGDHADARARFASVIGSRAPKQGGSGGRAELYAEVARANVHFGELYRDPRASVHAKSTSRREAAMKKAFQGYKTVLKAVPGNVFAANGLGMVLAEQGRLDRARMAFRLAREAMLEAEPVTVNLAHTELALGSGDAALQLYRYALRQCGGEPRRRVQLLRYLGRACVETKQPAGARRAVMEALTLLPGRLDLWYNLCYVMFEEAGETLRDRQGRTLAGTEQAARFLESSVRRLRWLQDRTTERAEAIKLADEAKARRSAGGDGAEESKGSEAGDGEDAAVIARGDALRAEAKRDGVTPELVALLLAPTLKNSRAAPAHVASQRSIAAGKAEERRAREEGRQAAADARRKAEEDAKKRSDDARLAAEEAAMVLQGQVEEINRMVSERRKSAGKGRARKGAGGKGGVDYDDEDVSAERLQQIAAERRAGDEDDAIAEPLDADEELAAVFGAAMDGLFLGDADAAGDDAAGRAPAAAFGGDDIFAGVPQLPEVAPEAPVGGGVAAARSRAAEALVAQLGGDDGDSSDDDDLGAGFDPEEYGAADAANEDPGFARAMADGASSSPAQRRSRRSAPQDPEAVAAEAMAAAAEVAASAQADKAAGKKRLRREESDSDSDSSDGVMGGLFDGESDDEATAKRAKPGPDEEAGLVPAADASASAAANGGAATPAADSDE